MVQFAASGLLFVLTVFLWAAAARDLLDGEAGRVKAEAPPLRPPKATGVAWKNRFCSTSCVLRAKTTARPVDACQGAKVMMTTADQDGSLPASGRGK